jgi:hypothetical protein
MPDIKRFENHWPTLETTLDRTFYARLKPPDKNGITVAGIGKQCADTFGEIRFACMSGYGLCATKLLRGLYERAVVHAYFAKNREAAERFLDSFAVDLGKLMRRHEEYAQAAGTSLKESLPVEVIQCIEQDYKRAKGSVEYCESCGAPKARVDVLSMARDAVPSLVPYYGLCYFEPTLHVHCTWYSVLEGVKVSSVGESDLEFDPVPEGERSLRTLQLSHFVILQAMETQIRYFGLELQEEVGQLRAEYDRVWGND